MLYRTFNPKVVGCCVRKRETTDYFTEFFPKETEVKLSADEVRALKTAFVRPRTHAEESLLRTGNANARLSFRFRFGLCSLIMCSPLKPGGFGRGEGLNRLFKGGVGFEMFPRRVSGPQYLCLNSVFVRGWTQSPAPRALASIGALCNVCSRAQHRER